MQRLRETPHFSTALNMLQHGRHVMVHVCVSVGLLAGTCALACLCRFHVGASQLDMLSRFSSELHFWGGGCLQTGAVHMRH
jgi:hypothetical protein